MQTVNKADWYLDPKSRKVKAVSGDGAVNGTRTEPVGGVSNDDNSFPDQFKDQLAYYDPNNFDSDDATADP